MDERYTSLCFSVSNETESVRVHYVLLGDYTSFMEQIEKEVYTKMEHGIDYAALKIVAEAVLQQMNIPFIPAIAYDFEFPDPEDKQSLILAEVLDKRLLEVNRKKAIGGYYSEDLEQLEVLAYNANLQIELDGKTDRYHFVEYHAIETVSDVVNICKALPKDMRVSVTGIDGAMYVNKGENVCVFDEV